MIFTIALLLQIPFLFSGVLIGPGGMFPISENFELFLIKVSSWSRWIYIPATAVVVYEMFRDGGGRAWLPWVMAVLDIFVLFSFWNAAREALDGYEYVDEPGDVFEQFRIDDQKENRDV